MCVRVCVCVCVCVRSRKKTLRIVRTGSNVMEDIFMFYDPLFLSCPCNL